VLENRLEWDVISPDYITLSGELICAEGVIVSVVKVLETRTNSRGRLEVRGWKYAYNAYFAGRHNILRYDNTHAEETQPDHEFHRHAFDLETGQPQDVALLHRHEMPLLSAFLDEVAALVEGEG